MIPDALMADAMDSSSGAQEMMRGLSATYIISLRTNVQSR